jgi:hypothetical protein
MIQPNFNGMEKRKQGRPRKEQTRIHITIRLEPKEKELLQSLAKELNCTFTDAVRALIVWDGAIDIQVIKTRLERLKTAN